MAAGSKLNPIVIPSYGTPLEIDDKTSSAWYRFFAALAPATSVSGTVPLAKLTGGGANGSLTFTNGILTGVVNPT